MPTLYTAERCPYAARARITLAEKGIAYDAVEIDLSDRPAWLYDKNPLGRVPVYEEDEGLVLPESEVIMKVSAFERLSFAICELTSLSVTS